MMGNCKNCPGGATDKDKIEAFETIISHADKYSWHDLRKDPTDLPTEKSDIHVVFRSGNEKLVTFFPDSEYKYTMEICHDADIGCINYTDLIAWKYIEPFEAMEKQEGLKNELQNMRRMIETSNSNWDYAAGYISAISAIEEFLAKE